MLECDFCGDKVSELSILDYDGWAQDRLTCEECFSGSDNGPAFSDLPSLQDRDRLIKKFTPLVKSLVKRHPDKDSEELFSALSLELVKAANWHVKQSAYGDGSFYNVAKMRLEAFASTFDTGGNGVTLHDNHIDPTPSPEESLIHSERLKDAEKLLKNLDPEQSRAIGLTLGGRTQAEVGKIMGVSQQTVSNLLKAGIVAIRQHK